MSEAEPGDRFFQADWLRFGFRASRVAGTGQVEFAVVSKVQVTTRLDLEGSAVLRVTVLRLGAFVMVGTVLRIAALPLPLVQIVDDHLRWALHFFSLQPAAPANLHHCLTGLCGVGSSSELGQQRFTHTGPYAG